MNKLFLPSLLFLSYLLPIFLSFLSSLLSTFLPYLFISFLYSLLSFSFVCFFCNSSFSIFSHFLCFYLLSYFSLGSIQFAHLSFVLFHSHLLLFLVLFSQFPASLSCNWRPHNGSAVLVASIGQYRRLASFDKLHLTSPRFISQR